MSEDLVEAYTRLFEEKKTKIYLADLAEGFSIDRDPPRADRPAGSFSWA